jgi:dihydrofolate reductase
MRLTLTMFLTLDSVYQAPGGPTEDTGGGFEHGGWTVPYGDEAFGATMTGWFARADAFLLGRHTYEIFASHWPHVKDTDDDALIANPLNNLPKYVASRTLDTVEWQNSELLSGDVADAVRKLKEQPGNELQVHGSGGLAQTLIEHDLVDEYRLLTFPIHLGTGKKLFGDGVRPGALRLVNSLTTSTGVVVSTYEPAGAPEYGSYELAQA